MRPSEPNTSQAKGQGAGPSSAWARSDQPVHQHVVDLGEDLADLGHLQAALEQVLHHAGGFAAVPVQGRAGLLVLQAVEQGQGAARLVAQQVGGRHDPGDAGAGGHRQVVDAMLQQEQQRAVHRRVRGQGEHGLGHDLGHRGVGAAALGQHLHAEVVVGDDARRVGLHQGHVHPGVAHGAGGVGHRGAGSHHQRLAGGQAAHGRGHGPVQGVAAPPGLVAQALAEAGEEEAGELVVGQQVLEHRGGDAVDDSLAGGNHVAVGRVAAEDGGEAEALALLDLLHHPSVAHQVGAAPAHHVQEAAQLAALLQDDGAAGHGQGAGGAHDRVHLRRREPVEGVVLAQGLEVVGVHGLLPRRLRGSSAIIGGGGGRWQGESGATRPFALWSANGLTRACFRSSRQDRGRGPPRCAMLATMEAAARPASRPAFPGGQP